MASKFLETCQQKYDGSPVYHSPHDWGWIPLVIMRRIKVSLRLRLILALLHVHQRQRIGVRCRIVISTHVLS